MAKKLYVGGLPYSTTEDALKVAFEAVGPVEEVKIITDKMSGRSRGFGFVTFTNDDDGMKAIEMFHGKDFEGRTLTVNEAKPLEDRPPRRSFGGGGASRGGYGRRDQF